MGPRGEAANRIAVVARQCGLASQDVVTQLGAFEEHVLEGVVYQVGGRILVGVDFVVDNLLLALQLAVGEGRAEGHVGEQLGRLGEVAAQGRGVDGGILLGGEGVELAAQILQPAVDLPGTPPLRPLEEGVLGKVGQSVFVGTFVAAPRIDHQRAVGHVALHLAVDSPNAVGETVGMKFTLHGRFFIGAESLLRVGSARAGVRVWCAAAGTRPYGLPRTTRAPGACPRRPALRPGRPPRDRGQ